MRDEWQQPGPSSEKMHKMPSTLAELAWLHSALLPPSWVVASRYWLDIVSC